MAIINKPSIYLYIEVCESCINISFKVICLNTKEDDCFTIWKEYISFCKKPPNSLPKWLYFLPFSLAKNKFPYCLTSSSAFISHSNMSAMVFHCCFIFNSLMIYDVEHIHIYFTSICTYSLVSFLLRSLSIC